jgi:2-polyprenyl-6-methoxyphenol hydroxylase-like FAD-dependent oxidoreductase
VRQPFAVIVGAGVAGLSAAWWLNKIGWRSLIVERADNLRSGGYMMSLSGPGYTAAERMGLLNHLEQVRHRGGESIYFDKHGRELLRLRHSEFLSEFSYLVLRRSDLIKALAEKVQGGAELRLATHVTGLDERANEVEVALSDGSLVLADLVIAADGVHSTIRQQQFVPEPEVLRSLGYRFAAYDVPDSLAPGASFLSYAGPGRISEFYKLSEGRLAALHVWTASRDCSAANGFDELKRIYHDDHPQVRAIIAAGGQGGRCPLIDDLALIEAPAWSKGRIVLLGDAAHCISLISGQGAGMAMTGAAVLSEELSRSASVLDGLANYEARMRPPIKKLQDRSRTIAKWFVPHSKIAFHLRNIVLRSMPSRMLAGYFRRALQSELLATGVGNDPDHKPG